MFETQSRCFLYILLRNEQKMKIIFLRLFFGESCEKGIIDNELRNHYFFQTRYGDAARFGDDKRLTLPERYANKNTM